VITTLGLANNQVHADGGRALARALRSSQSLTSLNLRLNRCVLPAPLLPLGRRRAPSLHLPGRCLGRFRWRGVLSCST
jgi:hypothetical protein